MKAFEIQSFGLPGLRQVERLAPIVPTRREVVVKLKACSLNYRDLMMVKGEYNPKQPLPLIPCSDGSGEIVEIGPDVTDFKPGDRVAAILAQDWISGAPCKKYGKSTLGSPLDGMLSEYRLFPEHGLIKIPEHLSYEEASTLPCAALTAWRALFVDANLNPGGTVLLQGTGGVSMFALQFAKMAGMKVIITSSSDDKLERAQKMGADVLVNYKKTPEWSSGLQADLVLELGGAQTLEQSIKAVRFGGQINLIGRLGGGKCEIDVVSLFMNRIRVQGIFVGNKADFEAMNLALTQNQIKPVIDCVFEFQKAPDAFAYLESAKHMGKVVIRI